MKKTPLTRRISFDSTTQNQSQFLLYLMHLRIRHTAILQLTGRMNRTHFVPDNLRLFRAMALIIVHISPAIGTRFLHHFLQFLFGCSFHTLITKQLPNRDLFYLADLRFSFVAVFCSKETPRFFRTEIIFSPIGELIALL